MQPFLAAFIASGVLGLAFYLLHDYGWQKKGEHEVDHLELIFTDLDLELIEAKKEAREKEAA